MSRIGDYIRRWQARPKVRPWALIGPVIILMICLPLLRPLRHPAQIGADEAARLATVRALVETGSLALGSDASSVPPQQTFIGRSGGIYSDQPPMFAVLLAGPYWVMHRFGNTFRDNPVLVPYLLTLIGVTIPVAGAAGLVYRMSRLFELRRIWRATLGLGVVLGSGLISYGVVLNPFAPAAVLMLGSVACVIYVSAAKNPLRASGWLGIGGLCAALAATFDPAAILPALLIACTTLTIRVKPSHRIGGALMFMIGAIPPIAVHAALMTSIDDGIMPRSFAGQLGRSIERSPSRPDEDLLDDSRAALVGRNVGRLYTALFGSHGLLSHFPIMLFGLVGVGAVMHRNWLPSTKSLAAASVLALGGIVGLYCFSQADWRGAMFAVKWFIVFSPMVLFWSGAWLRHRHSRTMWGIAAGLMFFSSMVAIVGATGPCPPGGFDGYTFAGAIENLIRGDPPSASGAPAFASK